MDKFENLPFQSLAAVIDPLPCVLGIAKIVSVFHNNAPSTVPPVTMSLSTLLCRNAGCAKIRNTAAFIQRCSMKKVFLNISQNSQENTCASFFFNKIAGLGLQLC